MANKQRAAWKLTLALKHVLEHCTMPQDGSWIHRPHAGSGDGSACKSLCSLSHSNSLVAASVTESATSASMKVTASVGCGTGAPTPDMIDSCTEKTRREVMHSMAPRAREDVCPPTPRCGSRKSGSSSYIVCIKISACLFSPLYCAQRRFSYLQQGGQTDRQ
jgi:hypothetical protein